MYMYIYIYICFQLTCVYVYVYIYICIYIYICRYSGVQRFNNFGVLFGFPSLPAELEIFAAVDEIEVLSIRGAPDPRHCRRNRAPAASRSSRSPELSTKSRFRGLAELQVIENLHDIELRRLRGAPNRALNADTGARWGALASISEESRSSKSSKILTKSTFGGFEELQVGNSTRTRERDRGGFSFDFGRTAELQVAEKPGRN